MGILWTRQLFWGCSRPRSCAAGLCPALEGSCVGVVNPTKSIVGCSSPRPLDNVFMEMDIHTGDDLLRSLTMAERILQQPPGLPVRLIIIDSIASIFRDAGDNAGVTEYTERAGMLFRIAGLLKRYAYQYDLAVVVTNQVTDVVEDLNSAACAHTGACKLMSGGRQVVPALGLSWANCVNTRIFLSKLEEHEMARLIVSGNGSGPVPSIRSMQVVFSPFLPPSSCLYVVQREGVLGVRREEE